MTDNTTLFSGRAEVYDRFRPGYPEAWLDHLVGSTGIDASGEVVDIGAGTGRLTEQLLARGLQVTAVEPNADMLALARRRLGGRAGFRAVQATAEDTRLPAHSMDLVTVAQAFHWFDPDGFRAECLRILRPGAYVALVWNSRLPTAPVTAATAAVCRRWCPGFQGFSGGRDDEPARIARFFGGSGAVLARTFPGDLRLDRAGFLGRQLSASYAPRPGEDGYASFVAELSEVFEEHRDGATMPFPTVLRSYLGRLTDTTA